MLQTIKIGQNDYVRLGLSTVRGYYMVNTIPSLKQNCNERVFSILQTIPDQGSMAITLFFRSWLNCRNKTSFLGIYNKSKNAKIQLSSQTHAVLLSLRRILTPSSLSFSLYPEVWFYLQNQSTLWEKMGAVIYLVIVLFFVWMILNFSLSNVSTPRNSEVLNCCCWIGFISQNYLQALDLYQHGLDKYSERWQNKLKHFVRTMIVLRVTQGKPRNDGNYCLYLKVILTVKVKIRMCTWKKFRISHFSCMR